MKLTHKGLGVVVLAVATAASLTACNFGGTVSCDTVGTTTTCVGTGTEVPPTAPPTTPPITTPPVTTPPITTPPITPPPVTTPPVTTPPDTTPPASELAIKAYVTGYSYFDNTPPGSPDISNPVIHKTAGGVGTFADPITVAVGHNMSSGKDVLDWKAGTKFYVPNLRRYLIVEDTCGDGKHPETGACHVGYPKDASTWLDVWVDGRDGTSKQADNCMDAITDVWSVIANPKVSYVVAPGSIAGAGCTQQFGNTPVVIPPVTTPPVTTPPMTTPPVTTPPANDSAAALLGWVPAPKGSDEFNYTGAPDVSKWGVYDGAGHAGNGRRVGTLNTVQDGYLRQTGKANGDSAGISSALEQKYGSWEARVRFSGSGTGNPYHPVLTLWTDNVPFPSGGEIDWLENNIGDTQPTAFVHHPTKSGTVQDQYHGKTLDFSQWQNVAVSWSPTAITGYLNGQPWFSDTASAAQPPGAMHATIQLDNFFGGGMQPATFDVDWFHSYK